MFMFFLPQNGPKSVWWLGSAQMQEGDGSLNFLSAKKCKQMEVNYLHADRTG